MNSILEVAAASFRQAVLARAMSWSVVLLLFIAATMPCALAAGRDVTIEDYLRVQALDAVEVSPAGRLVAMTFSRAVTVGDSFRSPELVDARIPLRNELVVVSASDGRTVWQLSGAEDGSSSFSPRWSPDGSKLAFLHSDREGNVSLRVWDEASKRLSAVSSDARAAATLISSAGATGPIAWISSREIVFTRSGDRESLNIIDPTQATTRAAKGEYSGRVWQTRKIEECRPDDALSLVDVDNKRIVDIAKGTILAASVAPNSGAIVAIRALDHFQPPRSDPFPAYPNILAVDYTPFVRWQAITILRLEGKWQQSVIPMTGGGPVQERTVPRWSVDGQQWTMIDVNQPFANGPSASLRSFRLGHREEQSRLFEKRSDAIAALARIGTKSGETTTPSLQSTFTSTVSPELLLSFGDDVNVEGRTRSGSWIVRSRKSNATIVSAVMGREATTLLKLNAHLETVAQPEPVAVRYLANEGDRIGWLFIPSGVRRPPVLVTAYPYSVPRTPRLLRVDGAPILHAALAHGLAVFVVDFRIVVPAPVDEEPVDRILSEIGAGVAALRRHAAVDGSRAVFYGHSFGGYTALNLLAHTTEFRGIVAAAPLGDLVSAHFSGWRHFSQRCGPAQALGGQMAHEDSGSSEAPSSNNMIMKMGGPPYEKLDKYIRNSPLLRMEHVRTPSLIIQGSEDTFIDGERLFNTLYRLGADSRLFYYWGEGHVISGPENVRHMVQGTISWILERLEVPSTALDDNSDL